MTVPQSRKTLLIISKGQSRSPVPLCTSGQGKKVTKEQTRSTWKLAKQRKTGIICHLCRGAKNKRVGRGCPTFDLVLTFCIIHYVSQQVSIKVWKSSACQAVVMYLGRQFFNLCLGGCAKWGQMSVEGQLSQQRFRWTILWSSTKPGTCWSLWAVNWPHPLCSTSPVSPKKYTELVSFRKRCYCLWWWCGEDQLPTWFLELAFSGIKLEVSFKLCSGGGCKPSVNRELHLGNISLCLDGFQVDRQ